MSIYSGIMMKRKKCKEMGTGIVEGEPRCPCCGSDKVDARWITFNTWVVEYCHSCRCGIPSILLA